MCSESQEPACAISYTLCVKLLFPGLFYSLGLRLLLGQIGVFPLEPTRW